MLMEVYLSELCGLSVLLYANVSAAWWYIHQLECCKIKKGSLMVISDSILGSWFL
jgi:uncharacterized protein with NRDE domain